jgi:hypothetical protein
MKSGFLEMMSASTASSQGPSPRRFEVDRRVAWVFGDPAGSGSGAAVEMIDPDGHHLEFYLRGSEVELQTLVATARRVE